MTIFAFVVDNSAGMATPFDRAVSLLEASKSAVEAFLRLAENHGNLSPLDRFVLVSYDEGSQLKSSLLDSKDHLLARLKMLRPTAAFADADMALWTMFDHLNLLWTSRFATVGFVSIDARSGVRSTEDRAVRLVRLERATRAEGGLRGLSAGTR
ncbi:hypothetical protein M427DRAFT_167241 [Gonapodya prolifera JEL478]|uniref:VWFA domain-containing protein n=1 Tax=Gonapodya prolifera (strain JEL478) TaxID=1344416 RepID=A0A139AZN1_GONPJ|nr:hypothetical protein M427DRAFT_167241 [Gonapodya prolifera JEL478]|eukprot:KXS22202.1 hypothetical protein M427DRAFT_167241 [Gonapodya prolifera JEL478]